MPTLEQVAEEFRRRIDALEDQAKKTMGALQLAPHQQGPRPGWFRAARIEGTQMILDFSSSQAGTSPLITVTDTAGVRRVEMGFLAANGNSPTQYGLRASNAAGTPIFDSLGLIAVMQQIGTNTQATGPLTGVAGPPTGLSGIGGEVTLTTCTFTISNRAQNVFLLAQGSNYVSCTGAHVTAHPLYFQVDGTATSSDYGYLPVYASAGEVQRTLSTSFGLIQSFSVGAHTVNLIWNSEEGVTDTCFNSINVVRAFLMGG